MDVLREGGLRREFRKPSARWNAGAASIVALGCGLAWRQRFVLDDAYISFRYARNLAQGSGLVFNIGERVEGYTNFLWTLWLALPHALGWDPVTFVYATGMVSVALTLVATLLLARRLLGPGPALLAGLLTATNPTFSAFATGGLETQWQALGVTVCAALAACCLGGRSFGHRRGLWLTGWSLLAGLTVMTRMDSALLLAPMLFLLVAGVLRHPRDRGGRMLSLLLPAGVLLTLWMLWRHDYYSAWLPNTFVVKSQVPGGWRVWLTHGGLYASGWLLSYGWILVLAGTVSRWRRFRAETGDAGVLLLVLPLLVWILYLVRIGGDFMEFRLFVAATPLMTTLAAWVALRGLRTRPPVGARAGAPSGSVVASVLLIALFLVLAGVHALAFGHSPFSNRIETIRGLRSHLSRSAPLDWLVVGQTLGREMAGAEPPVQIAVTAAGAIPYASGLPTVDMLGLSDRWIARNGNAYTERAGHRLIAPIQYLVERGVHLVIAHPAAGNPARREGYQLRDLDPYSQIYLDPDAFPVGSSVVEMPLATGGTLAMIYLTKHPRIDALIASGAWIRSPLSTR